MYTRISITGLPGDVESFLERLIASGYYSILSVSRDCSQSLRNKADKKSTIYVSIKEKL